MPSFSFSKRVRIKIHRFFDFFSISSENGLKSKFSIPSYTNEGHKYYRLYITESHYDYYVTIGELEIKLLQQ